MRKHSKRSLLRAIILILLPIVMILVEAMPNALAVPFSEDVGVVSLRYYSYFDTVLLFMADRWAILAAWKTCILLLLALIHLFWPKRSLRIAMGVLSALAMGDLLIFLSIIDTHFSLVACWSLLALHGAELITALLRVKLKAEREEG